MHIFKADQATDEILQAVNRLSRHLGDGKPPLLSTELLALISSTSSTLILARHPDEHGPIVGMLTLIVYRVPTGIRSIIEDVVVDESARGQGIAKAMMHHAIEVAREAGAAGIALTSNPRRVAANKLYQTLGFEQRETNAYYLKIEQAT